MINDSGFNYAFHYFRYDREVGDWAIVNIKSLVAVHGACYRIHLVEKEVLTCVGNNFKASCSPGQVLMIDTAVLQHSYYNQCDTSAVSDSCSEHVATHVGERCAGRRSCTILVGSDVRSWSRDDQKCDNFTESNIILRVIYSCLHGNHRLYCHNSFYTARRYASAVYAVIMCLSVTSRYG